MYEGGKNIGVGNKPRNWHVQSWGGNNPFPPLLGSAVGVAKNIIATGL